MIDNETFRNILFKINTLDNSGSKLLVEKINKFDRKFLLNNTHPDVVKKVNQFVLKCRKEMSLADYEKFLAILNEYFKPDISLVMIKDNLSNLFLVYPGLKEIEKYLP